MFKIILSPIAHSIDDVPPIVGGDAVTYRGQTFDLSSLDDGSIVDAEPPFVGKVEKENGIVKITLQYFYSTTTAEPMQSTSWDDYTFIVEDGQCPDPIIRKEVANEY